MPDRDVQPRPGQMQPLCISSGSGQRSEAEITQTSRSEAFAINISFRRRPTSEAWSHKGCIQICSVLMTALQLCGICTSQTVHPDSSGVKDNAHRQSLAGRPQKQHVSNTRTFNAGAVGRSVPTTATRMGCQGSEADNPGQAGTDQACAPSSRTESRVSII